MNQTHTAVRYEVEEVHPAARGTQVSLYLIPGEESEDGQIVVFTLCHIGAGQPALAYSNRWLHLGWIKTAYVAESLESILREHEQMWLDLDECHEGTEWDGNNHVGQWRSQDLIDDELEAFQARMDQRLQCYWSAIDWFSEGVDVDDLGGDTIREAAEAEVENAKPDAMLQVEEVEEHLRDALQMRLEELEDEAKEIDRIRQLLK